MSAESPHVDAYSPGIAHYLKEGGNLLEQDLSSFVKAESNVFPLVSYVEAKWRANFVLLNATTQTFKSG